MGPVRTFFATRRWNIVDLVGLTFIGKAWSNTGHYGLALSLGLGCMIISALVEGTLKIRISRDG